MTESVSKGTSFDPPEGVGTDNEPGAGGGFPVPGEGRPFDPPTGGEGDEGGGAGKGFPIPGDDD